MSELTDQLVQTMQSGPVATAVGKLSDDDANALAAILMAVVRGEPFVPQQSFGTEILPLEKFLELTPAQRKKLDEYDEYVGAKKRQFSEQQSLRSDLDVMQQRLDEDREEYRQARRRRTEKREQLFDSILERVRNG